MLPFPRMMVYGNIAPEPSKILNIKANYQHMGLLYRNGHLYLRGTGSNYKLGTGSTTNMYNGWIQCPYSVSDFWLSSYGTMIRSTDNKIYVCGAQSFYNTGTSNYTTWTDISSSFSTIDISTIKNVSFTALNLSTGSTLVLLSSGLLYGLGTNSYNVMGAGSGTSVLRLLDTEVSSIYSSGIQASFGYIKDGVYYRSGLDTNSMSGNNSKALTTFQAVDITGKVVDAMLLRDSTKLLVQDGSEYKVYIAGTNTAYLFGTGDTNTSTIYGTFTLSELSGLILNSMSFRSVNNYYISAVSTNNGIYTCGASDNSGAGLGRTMPTGTADIYASRSLYNPIEFDDSTLNSPGVIFCAAGYSGISLALLNDKLYYSGYRSYFTEQTALTGVQDKFTEMSLPE